MDVQPPCEGKTALPAEVSRFLFGRRSDKDCALALVGDIEKTRSALLDLLDHVLSRP
jgi:hypothetical protein